VRPRRQKQQPRAISTMTAAPPTAIPAIAPVDSIGEELEVALEVDVVMARVGVRTGSLAFREKYTGRSRLSQVAGAVTVAPPRELEHISMLDVSMAVVGIKVVENSRSRS
jgi:hypothetical protein